MAVRLGRDRASANRPRAPQTWTTAGGEGRMGVPKLHAGPDITSLGEADRPKGLAQALSHTHACRQRRLHMPKY